MDTLTLTEVKNKRTAIKASATRLKTYIENFDVQQGSRHDLTERKTRLSELWSQFDVVQSRIEIFENADPTVIDKEALQAQQAQQRASFETPYYNLMTRYNSLLDHYDRQLQRVSPALVPARQDETPISVNRESRVRLPKIVLPVFTGAYDDWYSFEDTFDKLIHTNEDLSEIEKFHYLRSSLQGKAAEIIKSIDTTTDNYNEAWEAVKERFDNKRWIIQKHLRAIFEAPLLIKENHNNLPKAWETSIPDKEIPNLKSLTEFLSKRCQALETIYSKTPVAQSSNTSKFPIKSKGSSVTNLATSNLACPQCKANHPLYYCEDFLKLPIDKRIQLVKKFRLCTNCLRSTSHQAKTCTSGACRTCTRKHNTLLHLSNSVNDNKTITSTEPVSSEVETTAQPIVTQYLSTQHSLSIILSTAVVHVYDSKNETHSARVLLDNGSQINFISRDLANKLRLKEASINISISGVDQAAIQTKSMINVRVKSRFNNFCENIECIILPRITQPLPQRFISKPEIVVPDHIKLADPNFNVPADIDMLIGAELFWRLLCAGQIRTSRSQPILQKTHLGWIISDPTLCKDTSTSSPVVSCLAVTEDLNRTLNRFWEVDHVMSLPETSPEEQACERFVQDTVKRNSDGRFVVQLPIKSDKLMSLGESRDIATRRFKSLERRLINSPKMYTDYKHFIQDYIDLGHMREVTHPLESVDKTYYLPHHAVYKETSTTTKLRVVFDGSCKSSSGVSLNEVLMVGPTIQDDLFSILARFRTFKYALTADIAKMYRQVLIDPSQTALQRILWRNSIDEPIRTFELMTVIYGTASAAFLSFRALRKLAEDNIFKFPIGAKTVLSDFYVDDLVTGADSLQQALTIKTETSQLLTEGRFELRKWVSNEPSLQDDSSLYPLREFILSSDKDSETRTLGLVWQYASDHFKFSSIACLQSLSTPTKRSVLSRIALIFDPLGLLGPSTVIAKIIMQDLWRLRIDWDESLPLDVNTKWKRYEAELPALRGIAIPRRVIALDEYVSLELHGFADASELAYGALSIPRLELCAALLLARLANKILKGLTHQIKSVYLWTDSTIVLAWLQSVSRTWTPFVANRVGEIQQLTTIQDWHHISSQDNPADLLSRGVMPSLLQQSNLWWSGPKWLNLNLEDWPRLHHTIAKKDIPEFKSNVISAIVTEEPFLDVEVGRNSSVLRLNPFLDEAGILRVGGRLKLSHLPYNAKHPALLPGRHPLSHLIIRHEHERHLHAGPQATLAAVRQNYWLVSARDVVRQITRKCVTCFRSSPKTASALMGNLPKHRITVPARPFEKCGVDYAGPFHYKEGSRRSAKLLKCYMAIFVCFSTTAVHIELATDLSTEAFLNVLKRFISRRGYPSDIYSDNGLNFVGAERELKELATLFNNQEEQQRIINYMAIRQIRWHFIPPRAPHHGGLWEAAVKRAKRHLYRVTKDIKLRYEELETLLIQIEAVLNSRPLRPMSSHPDDLTPLTPGHFLIGGPLAAYPEPSLEDVPSNRLSHCQCVEQFRQHIWQRWLKEYLHHCQQRDKWKIKTNPIRVGQMVLLKEDNTPPLSWPLARIVEIHPDSDNIVRTVTILDAIGVTICDDTNNNETNTSHLDHICQKDVRVPASNNDETDIFSTESNCQSDVHVPIPCVDAIGVTICDDTNNNETDTSNLDHIYQKDVHVPALNNEETDIFSTEIDAIGVTICDDTNNNETDTSNLDHICQKDVRVPALNNEETGIFSTESNCQSDVHVPIPCVFDVDTTINLLNLNYENIEAENEDIEVLVSSANNESNNMESCAKKLRFSTTEELLEGVEDISILPLGQQDATNKETVEVLASY
ncbi:PREDICTED: uncharacterized protein LOC105556166, partial [Vollenhovia emeryi]|uniref:uncharacterized protein LOC105556166 n=1 Tax=Vollenhovia emeryi TaxID=411798 RepID=UPI0005F3C6DB